MQRLTITIDDDLLGEVDEFIAQHGYANRSEAFRDLLRGGLEYSGAATAGNRHCIATLELCLRPCRPRIAEAADQRLSRAP